MADSSTDRIVRAITNDGGFRVITARTTDTVRGVIEAQAVSGDTARRLGEVVTGAVLVREAMAPQLRVQVIMKGAGGRGGIVADAQPGGLTRGLVQRPSDGTHFHLGHGALCQVIRTMPSGELHQGIVEAPREGGVSGALMAYMHQSEQITTFLAASVAFEGERLRAAGGYLVQVLPEFTQAMLAIMTERLDDFSARPDALETTVGDPEDMLGELLYGMEFTKVEESGVHFGCNCSQVKVVGALASLSREDIESLTDEGGVVELSCDYCGTRYQVGPGQLRGLLSGS
jgi:molecular chaperone Hsp33